MPEIDGNRAADGAAKHVRLFKAEGGHEFHHGIAIVFNTVVPDHAIRITMAGLVPGDHAPRFPERLDDAVVFVSGAAVGVEKDHRLPCSVLEVMNPIVILQRYKVVLHGYPFSSR